MMKFLTYRSRFHYTFTWIVFATIAVLTFMRPPEMPDDMPAIPHLDKVIHFLMFGGASVVWWWEFMLKRGYPSARWSALCPIAVAVSIIGGIDELLQGWLTDSRGTDFYDWVADTVGAFLFPAICRPLVNMFLPADVVRLRPVRRAAAVGEALKEEYLASFPAEERRDWDDILRLMSKPDHPLHFVAICHGGEAVGFITWWQFKSFRYVEHFVVARSRRGSGVGERALRLFTAMSKQTVALEVEPAETSAMAQRRIAFYTRCGFESHPTYKYVQPPYAPSLPSVPLMLMTAGNQGAAIDLKTIDHVLKVMVYNAKPDTENL